MSIRTTILFIALVITTTLMIIGCVEVEEDYYSDYIYYYCDNYLYVDSYEECEDYLYIWDCIDGFYYDDEYLCELYECAVCEL